MLMQNFKTAAELDITEPQKNALIKTLVLLETEKLTHVPKTFIYEDLPAYKTKFTGGFSMERWCAAHDCGTVGCIGGTAEMVGNAKFAITDLTLGLHGLFYPKMPHEKWGSITPEQAATALRSFLTTGDARWDLAVA